MTIEHTHHLALIPPLLLITYVHMIHTHPSVILSEDHQLLQLLLMFFFLYSSSSEEGVKEDQGKESHRSGWYHLEIAVQIAVKVFYDTVVASVIFICSCQLGSRKFRKGHEEA